MILTPEIKKLVEFFDLSDVHATIYIQWLTVILILWTFLLLGRVFFKFIFIIKYKIDLNSWLDYI